MGIYSEYIPGGKRSARNRPILARQVAHFAGSQVLGVTSDAAIPVGIKMSAGSRAVATRDVVLMDVVDCERDDQHLLVTAIIKKTHGKDRRWWVDLTG